MWSKFEMKFSEIMESELNKNYPGDSIENILNSIGNNQTLKGQIKELKKLYYGGIKKDSIENKYKTKFNLNPDQSLNSGKMVIGIDILNHLIIMKKLEF